MAATPRCEASIKAFLCWSSRHLQMVYNKSGMVGGRETSKRKKKTISISKIRSSEVYFIDWCVNLGA